MPCDLSQIKVLYRDANMNLWGIPYQMRPGQSPSDLFKANRAYQAPKPGHYGSKQVSLDDWRWLGSPGWYGAMTNEARAATVAFLTPWQISGWVPREGQEWTDLTEAVQSDQRERDEALLDYLTEQPKCL